MHEAPRPQPPIRLLILGGCGFIGRHAARAAARNGIEPVIGTRDPRRHHLHAAGVARFEPRAIRFEAEASAGVPGQLLDGIDAVLNCVGVLHPRRDRADCAIHHTAVAAWAAACAAAGLPFVHVSALGLEAPLASRLLRTKRAGEWALMASGADWRLVRPSLLLGRDGYGAAWLRRVARWPVHPDPAHARGRLAPLHVEDLALCLIRIATRPIPADADVAERIFELGGREPLTLVELFAALRAALYLPPAPKIRVPAWLCRSAARLFDAVHWTPYTFAHHELLGRDNLPVCNRAAELLGRPPRGVAEACAADAPAIARRPWPQA